MAKIARFNGNVQAFASNQQSGERRVFGATDPTESDLLSDQITPKFLRGWGTVGASEFPPIEWFNAVGFTTTQFISYLHQMGIPEWNPAQEYPTHGSMCIHNGEAWKRAPTWSLGDEPGVSQSWIGIEQSRRLKKITDRASLSGFVYEGQKVTWEGYHEQSDGGSNWGIIKLGAHIEDGFSIFSIDVNTYIEANLRGKSLNIRKAGAKGDKVTDDTARINIVKDYAEANVAGRFDSGLEIRIPNGDFRLLAPTGGVAVEITSSRITIGGISWATSVLYAPDADFDLVHFNGTTMSLYGCGMSRVRFNTPGNATAGCQLRTTKCIDGTFDKLYFVGHYDGLISDGCARTYFTSVIFTQDTRLTATSPRYAMDFKSDNGANNSDVHVSTYQIFMPDDRKTTYSVSIRGADGIYFNNGHHQGGVLVQPDGEGLNVCTSVFWTQVYMDKADTENIIFTGQSAVYRNFQFNGAYLRGSVFGMVVNTTGLIEKVKFVGGEISGHTKSGVDFRNANSKKFKFVGTDFDGNSSDNVLGDSDIIVRGSSHIVSACNFSGGKANGRAVNLTADSTNCTVGDSDFSESTQGIKLIDSGTGNKLGVNNGVVFKSKGTATIADGTMSITVNHGMDIAPDIDSIQVTPRTSLNGGVDFWTSNVNSTSFDINVSNAVSDNAVFSWVIDLTG
ncbi:hypothetical protein vBVpPvVp04M_00019 [Vibrio phage vB_Vp_PvVp04_M]|nr:hypothetical protein vBVpPvVp04M_00019 [Vibrio phage vB_Vp_PvVp04_M]